MLPWKRSIEHKLPEVSRFVNGRILYNFGQFVHFLIISNCISPGGISHPGENQLFVKKYSERVPLGRKANIDEISAAVVYLASRASSYVTGQNLIVDGGWTAW